MKCPVCERPNAAHAPYCANCGADLKDPDVLALAGAGPTVTAPGAEASLASDRFLGVRAAGLVDGGDLRRLAWVGGALLALAFLVPTDPDFRGLRMSWSLLGDGRSLALILPLLLGAVGVELAVLGARVPVVARAAILAAGGAAVLVLAIPALADGAGAATTPPWLVWGGVAVAAVGATARILRPVDTSARWLLAAGAALTLLGLVLPHDDARPLLPAEFPLYLSDEKLLKVSLLDADLLGLHHDLMLRFLALWHLVPLAAIPGAFALAWRRPSGPWDTKATGLRPLAWILVLYLPLTFLLYALNIAGWNAPAQIVYWNGDGIGIDAFMRALFAGRARDLVLTLGASAWLVGGVTALYLRYAPGAAPAATPAAPADPPADPPAPTA